jgi:hypothetical protein
LQGAIKEQFPSLRIIVKPISTNMDVKMKKLEVLASNNQSVIADGPPSRIGAFEVQLYMRRENSTVEEILHSKLRTGLWPNLTTILERIHYFQDRVPVLAV